MYHNVYFLTYLLWFIKAKLPYDFSLWFNHSSFLLMIKLLQSSHKMNSSKASRQFTFRLPDSDVTLNDTFILVMRSETEGKEGISCVQESAMESCLRLVRFWGHPSWSCCCCIDLSGWACAAGLVIRGQNDLFCWTWHLQRPVSRCALQPCFHGSDYKQNGCRVAGRFHRVLRGWSVALWEREPEVVREVENMGSLAQTKPPHPHWVL